MDAEVDLNLLVALDALLAEGSVGGAAHRLGLSESAMSRTLARLRAATGDALLVRAGRAMVPTPHAQALRERVRELALEARAVLQPAGAHWDLATLQRTFTLRANEAFIEGFVPQLVARAAEAAPGVRLHFVPKPDKDVRPLREGLIELDIGVLGEAGPEVRVQTLFRDRFTAAVRTGHPLLSQVPLSPERYAATAHVLSSRRGRDAGPLSLALQPLGLELNVAVVVPGFRTALTIAAASDLVAVVPLSYFERLRDPRRLQPLPLPLPVPPFNVSQMWHPRWDRDPAHRWLRELVRQVCGEAMGAAAPAAARTLSPRA